MNSSEMCEMERFSWVDFLKKQFTYKITSQKHQKGYTLDVVYFLLVNYIFWGF